MSINLPTTAEKEIPSLNGLRGIAILLVLVSHNFVYLMIPAIGWMGVDLFFVLSGFLITRILLNSRQHKHYFKNFYIRRILRIFPLYYLSILLLLLFDSIIKLPREFEFSLHIGYYVTYLQNLLYFIKAGAWEPKLILGHFWSLSVEEHFYLFWPVLVYYLNKRQLLTAGVLLILCSKLIAFIMLGNDMSWMAVYSFTFTRVETLVMGGMIAVLNASNIKLYQTAKWIFFGTATFLGGFYSYSLYTQQNWNVLGPNYVSDKWGGLLLTLIGLFFSSLLVFALEENRFQKWLTRRWLIFFGKYSYGIYVFHYPVFALVSYYRYKGKVDYSPYLPATWPVEILVSTGCAVATIGIAYASYHLVEKHFLALKTKFAYGT